MRPCTPVPRHGIVGACLWHGHSPTSLIFDVCITGCQSLETLPHSLGQLSQLTSLDMTGCHALAWLPGSIGHCQVSIQSIIELNV